ncbi:putative splicing factor 3a [Rosellinia necatrix]|uniref:Putative splicing factor 3a n=1 Tax=Rosellinia necatrix TaxID=77044 RepID=A0A1W2TWI7_ROSNE|nr:putative splicing factor 3a [Rosellinia necatrix]
MLLEEQRFLHEDLERLEQGIADRIGEEPKHIRDRLARDHQIAQFLDRISSQSSKLLEIYRDADGSRSREIQQIGTGDPMDEFYKQLADIKSFHAKYPNEPVENLERAYRPKKGADEAAQSGIVDTMFTGEEAFGRFFDLQTCHELYLNLPNAKRLTYLQYLDLFDNFAQGAAGLKRSEKLTDQYFAYVGHLALDLETFMRKTRPLENVDKVLAEFDKKFEEEWENDKVSEWKNGDSGATSVAGTSAAGSGIWCEACEKAFTNENVYRNHLNGKKHIRAESDRKKRQEGQSDSATNNGNRGGASTTTRLKERAIAERESRIKRLASAMSTERSDTRVNVERKQGMTERERQQELENLFSATLSAAQIAEAEEGDEGDDDEKIYNPLKLPLAWDGKPIPFWLYKLHGLGVEFACEICGNFVYMGRRAFDKHFNEARHIHGLKCLGITNTTLFRDITHIDEALRLWEKIQKDKRKDRVEDGSVVQMEDAEGNVMPEKVYYDLQKQGLL